MFHTTLYHLERYDRMRWSVSHSVRRKQRSKAGCKAGCLRSHHLALESKPASGTVQKVIFGERSGLLLPIMVTSRRGSLANVIKTSRVTTSLAHLSFFTP